MTRIKTVGAAPIRCLMTATPVFAQAAVQEPGAFAFYHPDGDVLNAGRPPPGGSSNALASVPFGSAGAHAMDRGGDASACALRYRSYDPQTGTFGHDGNRHPCR